MPPRRTVTAELRRTCSNDGGLTVRERQSTEGHALDVRFVPLEKSEDVVKLDDALQALAKVDERKSRVVELRYFGGLSVAETAAVIDVSEETVMRDWKAARAWLVREMKSV